MNHEVKLKIDFDVIIKLEESGLILITDRVSDVLHDGPREMPSCIGFEFKPNKGKTKTAVASYLAKCINKLAEDPSVRMELEKQGFKFRWYYSEKASMEFPRAIHCSKPFEKWKLRMDYDKATDEYALSIMVGKSAKSIEMPRITDPKTINACVPKSILEAIKPYIIKGE